MAASSNPHPLETLLAQSDWAKHLAGRLLGDGAGGEDCLQESWLAALTSSGLDGGRAPAWLRRVVTNFALQRLRSEGRRARRERQAARPESLPATDELVERIELQQLLARELLALPEVYRETLLLHFYEQRTSAEIARHLGIPAATVRARLARGLALLRERWKRRFPEENRWRAPLFLLVRDRPESSATLLSSSGGALVLGAAALSLVLFAWVWFFWRGTNQHAWQEPALKLAAANDELDAPSLFATTSRASDPIESSKIPLPTESARPARTGWWLLSSTRSQDGSLLADASVKVTAEPSFTGQVLEFRSQAHGPSWFCLDPLFRAPDGIPLRLYVRSEQEESMPLTSELTLTRAERQGGFLPEAAVVLELEQRLQAVEVRLHGRWLLQPGVQAQVALLPIEAAPDLAALWGATQWVDRVELGTSPEFLLRAATPGEYLLIAAVRAESSVYQASHVRRLHLRAGEQTLDLPSGSDASLAGQLEFAGQRGGAHCLVQAEPLAEYAEYAEQVLVWKGAKLALAAPQQRCNAAGEFCFEGLALGPWRLTWIGGPGGAEASAVIPPAQPVAEQRVLAPARDVILRVPDLVPNHFEFWRADAPLRGVRAQGLRGASDANGLFSLFTPPDFAAEVIFLAPASQPLLHLCRADPTAVRSPVRLEFPALPPPAELELTLAGDEERMVEAGILELHARGTDLDAAGSAPPPIWRARVRRLDEGISYLGLPAGEWLARWSPTGPGPSADDARVFHEERFLLNLRAGTRLRQSLHLRKGGWLRLLPGGYGEFEGEARWNLRSISGARVEFKLIERQGVGTRPAGEWIGPAQELESSSALAAGEYWLELEPRSGGLVRTAVSLRIGETTTLAP